MPHLTITSPLGPLTLREEGGTLVEIAFADLAAAEETPLLRMAAQQLGEYFSGLRRTFNLPLSPRGTAFQQAVWAALQEIPYGQTRTYAGVARALERPRACRAVGGACHLNPLPIVVPCHRVVGAGGRLTGYAGGLARKEALLRLERSPAPFQSVNSCPAQENGGILT